MRTFFLIGNPAAGRNALRKINEAATIIKNRGHDVKVLLTGKRGDAESFARQISSESGVQRLEFKNNSSLGTCHSSLLIIAAGGDGTYNEVINGIACANIPMAILPLGTTNVLAKELGVSEDVKKAIDIALSGRVKTVSLGKITARHLTSEDSSLAQPQASPQGQITRYFLLMAGIGYDAETVYGIKDEIKRYSGKGAYILSGLKTLLRWAPDKLTFTMNGESREGYSAIICKTSKYGGNFRIAPDADIKKNNFYAFIMHGRNRLDIFRYVSGIVMEKHLKFTDITYRKIENMAVKGKAHIQIDGDYFGMTPASIEIVPDALRLIY
ncbi:MAG: diacylglycerol kinase family lipid kinase [Thermodesulfovibrionales bacterium]|nr:diacylglycerol kinase family lipid kinase [Thermodesulfovibrionales bacterium]